jgi:hypothetical protein
VNGEKRVRAERCRVRLHTCVSRCCSIPAMAAECAQRGRARYGEGEAQTSDRRTASTPGVWVWNSCGGQRGVYFAPVGEVLNTAGSTAA